MQERKKSAGDPKAPRETASDDPTVNDSSSPEPEGMVRASPRSGLFVALWLLIPVILVLVVGWLTR